MALQVVLDSVVRKIIILETSMDDFATVLPDLMTAFQLIPYQAWKNARFKALSEEGGKYL